MTDAKPSKSEKKRQYLELQSLGERLMALTDNQLDTIATDDYLVEQVRVAKSTRAHGALRRQKQLIGKIMRNVDPEPIRDALDRFGQYDRMEKALFRQSEDWRDRLANNGAAALDEFRDFADADCDVLAALVSDHSRAPVSEQRRRIRRQLFREIHRILSSKMQSTSI